MSLVAYGTVEFVVCWPFPSMVRRWKMAYDIMVSISYSLIWLGDASVSITVRVRKRKMGQQNIRHTSKLLWLLPRRSLQR